jgi:HlyD family secretion protein
VRVLLTLAVAAVLLGTTVPIIVANFGHGPDLFRFKWRLDQEVPVEVRLSPAKPGHIARTIEAPGKVEADLEVKISAEVVGRMIKLPVREGDSVKKGDLLVEIDQAPYLAAVRSAESKVNRLRASIDATETDLVKSRRDFERNRKLTGAIAMMDVQDSETVYHRDMARLAMSRAELVEAEGALAKLKEDLRHTTISAPIDGIVSQLLAKEGEVVVIGTMNTAGSIIMEISDPNTMVVRARVDENNVPAVQPGQKTMIHFQNNAKLTLTGTVKRISPKGIKPGSTPGVTTTASDNDVAIFETIISIDAPPPQVRLGMNASVEILVEERDACLTIPAQAVQHRRAKDLPRALAEQLEEESPRGPGTKDPSRRYHQVVFVEADGKANCRLVRTGVSDESRVEVLDGLREGERVIAGPYRAFDKLRDGRPVTESAAEDDAGS